MKLLVSDVQRSSFVDGPGIRTTLFLKGCPLNCRWCHNPETISRERELSHSRSKCLLCRRCLGRCSALRMEEGRLEIDRGKCDLCGYCVEACPQGAFKVIGEDRGLEELRDLILKDRAYYDSSGGGVTLSGGEALLQKEGTLALCRMLKAEGIHIALDTSGALPRGYFTDIEEYVDLFLYDYKASSGADFSRFARGSYELSMGNLDYLYERGNAIILRCPLIPGMNDTPEHREGIIAMSEKYPRLRKIEILPWHSMGRGKAESLGYRPDRDLPDRELDKSEKEEISAYFRGIELIDVIL